MHRLPLWMPLWLDHKLLGLFCPVNVSDLRGHTSLTIKINMHQLKSPARCNLYGCFMHWYGCGKCEVLMLLFINNGKLQSPEHKNCSRIEGWVIISAIFFLCQCMFLFSNMKNALICRKNGFVACKPPVQNLDKASWPPVKSFNTKGCLYVTGPTIFS